MDQFVDEKKLDAAAQVAADGEGEAVNYFHCCTNEEAEERRSNPSNYVACFCVAQGKGLAAMDANGSSDPYVMVDLVAPEDSDNELAWEAPRSVVRNKTLNPVWNFGWSCMKQEDIGTMMIVVEVWDKDTLSADDFMGRLVLPIAELSTEKTWYNLQARPGSKSKVKGAIQVIGRYDTPATLKEQLAEVPLPMAELRLQSLARRQQMQSPELVARLAECGFVYAPGPSVPPEGWAEAVDRMATEMSPQIQHGFVKDAYKCLYPGTVLAADVWALEMSTFHKREGPMTVVVVGLLPSLGLIQCALWEPASGALKRRAFIKFVAHHFRTKRTFSRSVLSMILFDTNRYYLEGPAIVDVEAGQLAMYVPGRAKDGTLEIFQRSEAPYGTRNTDSNAAKSWQWTYRMHNQCIVGGLESSLVTVGHGVRSSGGAWKKVKSFFKEPRHKLLTSKNLSSHELRYVASDAPPS